MTPELMFMYWLMLAMSAAYSYGFMLFYMIVYWVAGTANWWRFGIATIIAAVASYGAYSLYTH